MKVQNEKELGQALKNNVALIEVEFDLKNQVLKIRSVGKVAWGICIGSIAVAVTSILATMTTGGTLVH